MSWLSSRVEPRFVALWTMIWALGLTAIIPAINAVTPLLNPAYENFWTPGVFWRLVLYWHGAIFMPLITVAACLIYMTFGLDKAEGTVARLLRESILYGGIVATPLAGIAGIFDVYDRFAFGIPLWLQIIAFLIGDEMAIALIVAMLIYPKQSGKGYEGMGLPYYTVLVALIGVLIAAIEGHIAGWITWAGPWPSLVANYVNYTMYPVLGYYNATAVQTFTVNVVTSHSHTMLPLIMAGIVALVGASYGYHEMKGSSKFLAAVGFLVMAYMIIAVTWLYVVAGVGNYAIPALFSSGPNDVNGLAMDDAMTGMIGWGALFVLIGLLLYMKRSGRLRDPIFAAIVVAWILIYLVIPGTGYYVEFHEVFYGFATPPAPGWMNDAVYTRFHQDFAFFLLPSIVVALLLFRRVGLRSDAEERRVSYALIAGMILTFLAGETYFATLATPALYAAVLGAAIIWVGLALGTYYAWRAYAPGGSVRTKS
ncbi:hypothetical protein [Conexivisphaera calida]|uniref:TVG1190485 protein n=1 Tax=Conexivisphaera calida TaxID=1874277 RepID=A0A4P2VFE9_9ARCH|nr:hypothetical protein [Conexivisphaera calida]BBE42203.1 TVG1190485 protein [Conexivisphaera calida]